jgi:hypothetical protein
MRKEKKMKRFIYLLLLILVVCIVPYKSFAQSGTLVIYASLAEESSLDAVIAADQASGSPHLVYQLASTDTPYIFYSAIVIDNDVTITGVLGANNRPPCIQPAVLMDNSIPGHLFTFTKAGSVVRLENLYMLGISVANTVNWGDGFGVTVTGDNIKTYIDNCVLEQWGQFGINFSGQNDGFWITNCKFRNFVNNTSVYTGEPFRMRNDLGVTLVDTIVMRYNTFLAVNAYVACVPVGGYAKYVEFIHNTVVGCFKNPFFSMNVTNWKVNHNIFYATYVGGMANGEYPWWDRIWDSGVGSTIDLDPMNIANAGRFGIDTTQVNWSDLAEAARTIQVNDNIYFRPQSITDYVNDWNSTHTGTDSIVTTEWMNEVTTNMFADDTRWPGLNDDGNLVGTDPEFGAGITTMIAAPGTTVPPGNGIGLLPYLAAARANGGIANDIWAYAIQAPDFSSTIWTPTWPLPEETSNDLRYSASLTATDGVQYGDPYWFTLTPSDAEEAAQLPNAFVLYEAYPNPFNPSTNIRFNIPESGNVTLKVYNLTGQEVKAIIDNEFMSNGTHNIKVDMSNLSSGVYFFTLKYNFNFLTKKMVLLK